MGVLSGAANNDVIGTAKSVLDFIYFASFHTSETLTTMKVALQCLKDIFVRPGTRADFNISKIHLMSHYIDAIRSRGSADKFNPECSERFHIDYAKGAYRASNWRDYLVQMTTRLLRQEAVETRLAYLKWLQQKKGVGDCNKLDEEAGSEIGTHEEEASHTDMPSSTSYSSHPSRRYNVGVGSVSSTSRYS